MENNEKRQIEAVVEILRSTLGNMPSHQADKIVAGVIQILENMPQKNSGAQC